MNKLRHIKFSTGILKVISATDCVKDRLAAYCWGDKQALSQAILVANENIVDIKEIERWLQKEVKLEEFELIIRNLIFDNQSYQQIFNFFITSLLYLNLCQYRAENPK